MTSIVQATTAEPPCGENAADAGQAPQAACGPRGCEERGLGCRHPGPDRLQHLRAIADANRPAEVSAGGGFLRPGRRPLTTRF